MLDLLSPTTSTDGPNWLAIKADFEDSEISVREIARRHGVSDSAVHKKAKAEGWNASLRATANQVQTGPQTEAQTAVQTTPPLAPGSSGDAAAAVEQIIQKHTAPQPKPEDDEFKWDMENPDVLVWDRPSIALYYNKMGQIVIREEARWPDDEDPYIRIDRHDVPALIEKLRELAQQP
jgi:hypothetical protein